MTPATCCRSCHQPLSEGPSEVPESRTSSEIYSPDQLRKYFKRISLDEIYRWSPIINDPSLARTHEYGMPLLTALVRCHQAEIPFENLNIHCYPNPMTRLSLHDLYDTMVGSGRGRGGPCTMLNSMFSIMLRSLGFEVIDTAARVNQACQAIASTNKYQGPRYNGWDHRVILVVLSRQHYLVDVGMGTRGPIVVLPLLHGFTTTSIAPSHVRLLYGHLSESSSQHPSDRMWRLECRSFEASPWIPTYAFGTTEWFQADFEVLQWYWFTNSSSWMVQGVVATRLTLDHSKENGIGFISFANGVLRDVRDGKLTIRRRSSTPEEAREILRTAFGIHISDEEAWNLERSLRRIGEAKL